MRAAKAAPSRAGHEGHAGARRASQSRRARATGAALLTAALGLAQMAVAGTAEEPPREKPSDVLKQAAARPLATPINDRFAIRASYFPASVDSLIRLDDSDGNPGTPVSGEGELGMPDRRNQGRVEALLRLHSRHRVRLDYYYLPRRGDAVMTRAVDFGDQTFEPNERVLSELDGRMLNLNYLYSVVHNQRLEVGAGVALHLLDGEVHGRVPARFAREDRSTAVAFPTFAADATLRIGKRFSVNARANYLSAHVDESTGLLSDLHADVQYRWKRNLAVGLGYSRLKADLYDVDTDDLAGRIVFRVDGPELFFRASF